MPMTPQEQQQYNDAVAKMDWATVRRIASAVKMRDLAAAYPPDPTTGLRDVAYYIGQYAANDPDRVTKGRQAFEAAKREWAEGKSREALNKPIDLSFLTPEYLAAQERVTTEPLRRAFGTARQQGINASLRTGGPVGAFINSSMGEEGQALGEQSSRNFLSNQQMGFDISGRRFGQGLGLAQFDEGMRQFEVEQQRQAEEARRARKWEAINGIANAAGTFVGAAGGNPFSFLRKGPPGVSDPGGYWSSSKNWLK